MIILIFRRQSKESKRLLISSISIWSRAASSLADSSEAGREAPVKLSTAVKPEVGSVAALFSPNRADARTCLCLRAPKICFKARTVVIYNRFLNRSRRCLSGHIYSRAATAMFGQIPSSMASMSSVIRASISRYDSDMML